MIIQIKNDVLSLLHDWSIARWILNGVCAPIRYVQSTDRVGVGLVAYGTVLVIYSRNRDHCTRCVRPMRANFLECAKLYFVP